MMISPLRIVIVEDELLLRSMLRLFCEVEPNWRVVGEADDCASACSMVEAMQPDIVLLDLALGMENGLDCLPQLLRLGANRVLVLTGNADPTTHLLALGSGAAAVLQKGEPTESIRRAIREQAAAMESETMLLPTPPAQAIWPDRSTPPDALAELNPQERQLVELLAAGRKDEGIARELGVSPSALQQNLQTIYDKLGVEGRVQLVVCALEHRLVTPNPVTPNPVTPNPVTPPR